MGKSKVKVLQGRVDIFVDDAYHNYKELNEAGIECLLMSRSHNTKEEVYTKRIFKLNEVLDYDNTIR